MTVASQYRRVEAILIRAADSQALLAVAGQDWITEATLVILKEIDAVMERLSDMLESLHRN
jgi:hypothetical protein